MRFAAWLLLAVTTGACSSGGREGEPPVIDAGPRRGHKIPVGRIRAFPPHAIRSDGIGPYLLDERVGEVWEEVPEGPNVEVLQLGRYANWGLVHAEASQILIGIDAERRVAFIAVLAPELARTPSGVGVGATGAQLEKALGPPRVDPGVVRDRLIYEFPSLPNVRFVTDSSVGTSADAARVVAVLVVRDESAPKRDGAAPTRDAASAAAPPPCRTGGPLAAAGAELLQAVRAHAVPTEAPMAAPLLRFGCVSGAAPEAIVLSSGELDLYGGEPGHLRRVATTALPAADFLGALDIDGDGRDEIVWGLHHRGDHERSVEVHVLRLENGRLVETLAERPIVVGDAAAALAGQIPSQVDLLVEVRAQEGSLELGGLFLGRTQMRTLRQVAPLTPVVVREAARADGLFDAEPHREHAP